MQRSPAIVTYMSCISLCRQEGGGSCCPSGVAGGKGRHLIRLSPPPARPAQAASESPFLDNKLESATAVLCVMRLPPSTLGIVGGTNGHVTDAQKEYALRSAVQVGTSIGPLLVQAVHAAVQCAWPQCDDSRPVGGVSV